jgi:diguanylate cyclase (GGDEF)-like protein
MVAMDKYRGTGSDAGWKYIFGAVLLGAVVCTLAAGSLFPGGIFSGGSFALPAVMGELLAGGCLYLFLDHGVFRPAERGRKAVALEYERAHSDLEREIRDKEDNLRRMDILRRDLEETKDHLQAKIKDLRTIYEVSTAIAGTLDTEEIFRILPGSVMQTLELNDFCILIYDSDQRMLVCRAGAELSMSLAGDFRIAPGEGVSGRVFETGEPVYIPDVRSSPEFRYYGGKRMDVRSFMCMPLMSRGKVIGVLNVNHSEPNAFDAESLATLSVMASFLAIAIENANLFHFVKGLAEKDSLTLLYNHGAFHEKLAVELERASRYGRPLSVIMMDLDDFKRINDTYGHVPGDRILVLTAGVLCAHLRKSDIPSRYGGDEFAVILPETDLGAASAIASRIAAGISEVRMDTEMGEEIAFTASIGYASCLPESRDRDNILNVADRLMYESKRRGRGGVLGEQL